ncbi:uncharacterized protein LOC113300606 [Papaver somniferum]|uniref:uncharacterized protein LOC113300606 n=1 Tax=Papaver somniferum TaxID=3469 RepID=UPI000E6F6B52|nr:uncharacterized protein LOC113300606 [Papaver somniferum]
MSSSSMLSLNNTSTLTSNFSTNLHSFKRNAQTPILISNGGFLKTQSSSKFLLNSHIIISSSSSRLIACCAKNQSVYEEEEIQKEDGVIESEQLNVEIGNPPPVVLPVSKLNSTNQVFFLLAFIAATTSIAFTSLVVAAVPALYEMGRAAISLSKLADTAREELPSTMAAIRLSGMEISDLTLELSDLSQEISDGVNKSAQAVQAAEAGIRQVGTIAKQQAVSMIQERANLPVISIQPVVVGAAKKTSRAVGNATKTLLNMITRGESTSDDEDHGNDRIDLF